MIINPVGALKEDGESEEELLEDEELVEDDSLDSDEEDDPAGLLCEDEELSAEVPLVEVEDDVSSFEELEVTEPFSDDESCVLVALE